MRLLLIIVASHMSDGTLIAWASEQTYAAETGLSVSTVAALLKQAEKAGLIHRHRGNHKAFDITIEWGAVARYTPVPSRRGGVRPPNTGSQQPIIGSDEPPIIGGQQPNTGGSPTTEHRWLTTEDRLSDHRTPVVEPPNIGTDPVWIRSGSGTHSPEASEPDPTPEPDWDAIDAKVTATREAEIAALATPKPLPRYAPKPTSLPGMPNGPKPRTPHPFPEILRRDRDRGESPAGSSDASSGDAGAHRGAQGVASQPAAPGSDLPPGAGGHAAPAPGPVLGPPVAAGVDDDVSPVRVGDRVLAGDLPALLSGMPSGDRVALALVKGGTLTTRALLRVRPDQLRYTKGLGGQGADNVVRHLAALGVEPGCLSPELEDERVWDQCLTGPPPQPGEPTPAYLRPRHLAALSVVGGRLGIRRANQFDVKKLREKFLNHCKAAPS